MDALTCCLPPGTLWPFTHLEKVSRRIYYFILPQSEVRLAGLLCLGSPSQKMDLTFAFFHLPQSPLLTTPLHHPPAMTHTPYSSYNYSGPLTSIHISKLLLVTLLPLALYHSLPFQGNTLTYMSSFKAPRIWLRFFKETLALS